MLNKININGFYFELKVIRDSYHRIKASVKNNTLIISCHYSLSDEKIYEFIEDNKKKIYEIIIRNLKNNVKENIIILGNKYQIKESNICCIDNDIIYSNDIDNIKYFCANHFFPDLYNYLRKKVEFYFMIMYKDKVLPTISIVNVRTYYGQYDKRKNHIKFNVCLMFNSLEVIDSVIVHELAHIKYMNHQKEFYNFVKKVLPNYDFLHKKLKKEGLYL